MSSATIRPLERADLDEVVNLYELVARSGSGAAPTDLRGYFERFFFDHPWADDEIPSLVYVDRHGRVAGFLGSHVRRFRFDGRPIRIACSGQLVTHPARRAEAPGLFLLRDFLAGKQAATITDTASAEVGRIWERLGGDVLEARAVGWARVFEPARFARELARRRGSTTAAWPFLKPVVAGVDAFARRLPGMQCDAPTGSSERLEAKDLVEQLGIAARHLRLHPEYDEAFVQWLFGEMECVTSHGELVRTLVRTAEGAPAGWYISYFRRGGVSQVLQSAAHPGHAELVLAHLLDAARSAGSVAVQGRLEPGMVDVLSKHRCVLHRSGYLPLFHSRDASLLRCAVSSKALLTRMDGEWWNGHHLQFRLRAPVRPKRSRRGRPIATSRRVLVSGGEYVGVLAAVRDLKLAGYEPWVTTTSRRAYASLSRAVAGSVPVPDPAVDADGFVAAVAEAARDLSIRAFLPGTESALLGIAGRADAFPEDVAVGTCSAAAIEAATDKTTLAAFAESAGLKVPPTFLLNGTRVNGDISMPAVVKPLRSEAKTPEGRLRHGVVRRVDSATELSQALAALPGGAGLVQPYIAGRVTAVGGVFWDGALVASVHQAAHRIWPTDCGVISYATTIERDAELEKRLVSLLEHIDWRGLFQVQFLETEHDRYLIDLNPRIYGSLALARAAGQNLTAIWTDLLLGNAPVVGEYRVGVRYRAEELDARALLKLAASGRIGEVVRGALPRARTVHAVFARNDPLPVLTSVSAVCSSLRDQVAR